MSKKIYQMKIIIYLKFVSLFVRYGGISTHERLSLISEHASITLFGIMQLIVMGIEWQKDEQQ